MTRTLIDLFLKGELPTIQEIMVEPEYGYAGRVMYQNGTVRIFKGSDVGINTSGAKQIATDKGYTKYFLQRLGYQTPLGKVFLLPQYIQDLDKALSKYTFQGYAYVEEIDAYVTSMIGYPCFLKPNEGSKGKGVSKCFNKQDIEATVADYQLERLNMVLVEQTVLWPDYRVVVLKDEVIACYSRRPLTIVGDGMSTIRELLLQKRTSFISMKRTALIDPDDTRITRQLAKRSYDLETVLPQEEVCPIYDVSNLSAGGELEDFTERIDQGWRDLCITVTAQMGLNFCGLDFACANIENANAGYSILELNGSPGLDNYAASDEKHAQRVKRMYKGLSKMKLAEQLPANRWPRQIVPYQTWGYFMKDLSDAYKIKIARLAIFAGGLFLSQSMLMLMIYFLFNDPSRTQQDFASTGWVFLIIVVPLWLIIKKLFKNKALWVAIFALLGEIAFFFSWIYALINPSPAIFYLSLILGLGFTLYEIIRIVLVKKAAPLLTDQEFDDWVEQKARNGLISTIHRLGLSDEIRNIDELLCVRGYVLPGMRNARHYNRQNLLSRRGVDGRWRYSVNIYTYFYPAEHQIIIFIYDINAMNWADYREATKEYFYEDVIGATTEDEQDTIDINGRLFNYRDQRFALRLCDGFGIGATVRSVPLDNIANLPTFDMPNSGVDRTIAQLRMLLRSKKWRTV